MVGRNPVVGCYHCAIDILVVLLYDRCDTVVLLIIGFDGCLHFLGSGIEGQGLREDLSAVGVWSNHGDLVRVPVEIAPVDSDEGDLPVLDCLPYPHSLDLLLLSGVDIGHGVWLQLYAHAKVVVTATLTHSNVHVVVLPLLEVNPLRELNTEVA